MLKWNELGKDTECDGKKHIYRVQWKENDQISPYVKSTKEQTLLVEGSYNFVQQMIQLILLFLF